MGVWEILLKKTVHQQTWKRLKEDEGKGESFSFGWGGQRDNLENRLNHFGKYVKHESWQGNR